MKTPLNDALDGLWGHVSFHTPGYQPMADGRPRSESPFWRMATCYDVTELPQTDNLLSPCGVIAASQAEISAVYGAECSTFITAGATCAVRVALQALAGRGSVLVLGDAHGSVYRALRSLSDPVYHCPLSLFDAVGPRLKPATVVVTSPDYAGNTLPLGRLAAAVEAWGGELVVDASHGSHFAFSTLLPQDALHDARFVVHSLHKTMPVPTGSALLHYPAAYAERVALALAWHHTTSPYYPAMAAIERAVALFAEQGEGFYARVYEARRAFQLSFRYTLLPSDDCSRFVLRFPFAARLAADALWRERILPEYYRGNEMTLIVTPYNVEWLPKVAKLLNAVDAPAQQFPQPRRPEALKRLRFYDAFRCVDVAVAEGQRAFWEVGPYPPGTPWVVSGERIDAELVEAMQKAKSDLFGLVQGRIPVVQ